YNPAMKDAICGVRAGGTLTSVLSTPRPPGSASFPSNTDAEIVVKTMWGNVPTGPSTPTITVWENQTLTDQANPIEGWKTSLVMDVSKPDTCDTPDGWD